MLYLSTEISSSLYYLQNLIKLLGEKGPSIEKLLEEADKDGDGMISFEEFLVMFRNDNNLAAKEEFPESDVAESESDQD